MSRFQYLTLKVLGPFIAHSNASAAKPSLYAALDPDAQGGVYYGPQGYQELRGRVGKAKRDPDTRDEALAARLWEVSESYADQPFQVTSESA